MDLKHEFGLSDADIAKKLDELCDDDFYAVMLELAKIHDCGSIEKFGEWLKQVLYEIAVVVHDDVKYEINSLAEMSYIEQFIKGGDFREPLYREQLRALWMSYCFHHNLDVDTYAYDVTLHSVWQLIQQGDWSFDDFDAFMCQHLV